MFFGFLQLYSGMSIAQKLKVTNLEVVKIEFRHLPLCFFLSSASVRRCYSAFLFVYKIAHYIAVTCFLDGPFELQFLRNCNRVTSNFTITIACK